MAYDVQRFNELTKQMSAYAHYQRGQEHLELAAKRAARRARARELAEQLNQRLRFRLGEHGPRSAAADRTAAAGLRAPGPPGRRAHAVRQRAAPAAARRSATSGSSPAGTPEMPTAATGPPTATHSNGGYRCPPGGERRRRREASAAVVSVLGRSTRRDTMHARRPDCQPPAPPVQVRSAARRRTATSRAHRRQIGQRHAQEARARRRRETPLGARRSANEQDPADHPRGRVAAVVIAGQAIIPDALPRREQATVKAMCLYALEIADGRLPGPYSDTQALAYARAAAAKPQLSSGCALHTAAFSTCV